MQQNRPRRGPRQPCKYRLHYSAPAIHTPLTPSRVVAGNTTLGNRSDFVADMDWQVGQIVQALKDAGVYENTMVILSSDNGGTAIPVAKVESNQTQHPSGPYRAAKSSIYEGGHRVPLIWSWPGKVKSDTVSDQLVSVLDVAATLKDITRAETDLEQHYDSISMLPLLMSDTPDQEEATRDRHFYLVNKQFFGNGVRWDLDAGNEYGVQAGEYLHIFHENDSSGKKIELYNLSVDVSQTEENNLIDGALPIDVYINNPEYGDLIRDMQIWYDEYSDYRYITDPVAPRETPKTGLVGNSIISINFLKTPSWYESRRPGSFGSNNFASITSEWNEISVTTHDLTREDGSASTVSAIIDPNLKSIRIAGLYDDHVFNAGLAASSDKYIELTNLNNNFPNGYRIIIYVSAHEDLEGSKFSLVKNNDTVNGRILFNSRPQRDSSDLVYATPNKWIENPSVNYLVYGLDEALNDDHVSLKMTNIMGDRNAAFAGIQIVPADDTFFTPIR
ncbi:MAG: sulfatase-like hydrolase/transferase [Planctomycetes bacterium]|nr:sulfatase-like hydrolase/transferase [Planctomycetota bacterium]